MSNGKRGRNKDPYTQQVVEALRDDFPKFTNVSMSLIKNPAYGLQLSPQAEAVLKAKGILSPNKKPAQRSSVQFKFNQKRERNERIEVRLSSAEKVRLLEQVKANDCKSVREYITKLIKENEL